MKPLRLTIQAFGPYAGEQVFDFRMLENTNLFLITGDTGSGKTTMFDAMGIALFGESSGGDRKSNDMRSDFAEKAMPTFCRFEFELRGNVYRSNYQPEQQRPKARGDGFTTQSASAWIHQLDDINQADEDANCLAEGLIKTKDAVGNLLQLNSNQFRQVIMLAQGQFRKLLEASSNDREAIFERLFGTELYSAIQNDLKERSKGIGAEISRQREALGLRLETVVCADTAAVTEEINSLDLKIKQTETEIKQAGLKVKQADATLQLLREQNVKLDAFEQATSVLSQVKEGELGHKKNVLALNLHREAQGIYPAVESVIVLRSKSKELVLSEASFAQKEKEFAGALIQAKDVLTGHKKKKPEIERLSQTLHNLESVKPAIAEWKKYAQEVVATTQQKASLESEEVKLKASIAGFDLTMKEMDKQILGLRESASKLVLAQHQQADVALKIKQMNELSELKRNLLQQQLLLDSVLQDAEAAKQARAQLQMKCDVAIQQQIQGQAALLAATLQHGKECPVCGALEHPSPQKHTHDILTEQELKALAEKRDAATASVESAQFKCTEVDRVLTQLTTQVESLSQQVGDTEADVFVETLKQAVTAVNAATKAKDALDALLLEQEQLKVDLEGARSSIEGCRAALSKAAAAYEKASSVKGQIESQVEDRFREKPDLLQIEIQSTIDKKDALLNAIEAADFEVQRVEKTISANSASLREVSKQARQVFQELEQKEDGLKQLIASSRFESEEAVKAASLKKDIANELQLSIEAFNNQLIQAQTYFTSAKEQAKGLTRKDESSCLEACELAENALAKEQLLKAEHDQRLQILNTNLVAINLVEQKILVLETEYGVLGDLADVANGRGKNTHGANFQKFILAHILDRVLEVATVRLQQMTKGRFSLFRAQNRESRAKAFGLELNLFDQHTSTEREVRTLSGGEGFMASLALALGLSDVVQQQTGGVQLDTLLIDEGFGALSPDSLDECIKVLEGLGGTGKLVGVISHVAELKERIDAQLVVKGSPSGSRAEFIV